MGWVAGEKIPRRKATTAKISVTLFHYCTMNSWVERNLRANGAARSSKDQL